MRRLTRTLIASLLTAAIGAGAVADTLTDTLIKAYQLSPLLEANRASLRSLDENVAQARTGRRPQVTFGAGATVDFPESADYAAQDVYSAQLRATLNLYDGGETRAAIEAATASVSSGRAQLKDVEQTIFLDAVTAYMDVRRDLEFVALGRNNVSVLTQQVRAAQDRFELGEVTRTDVSLAQARLAAAQATLASFTGRLEVSREQFRAVVGVPARDLQPPPPVPPLPPTIAAAEAIAMREHPELVAIRFAEIAAQFNVERARAPIRPSVDATAAYSFANQEQFANTIGGRVSTGRETEGNARVTLEASIPLYTGGRLASLVRQAEAVLQQRKFEVQNTARRIRQATASAWAELEIARASIVANRQQVAAAQIAFNGVREEATLGARTTLDVLDREQELRDAQVQLAASIRDEYVAAYNLLSSMGLLTVEHLNLGIPVYNPDYNYQRVNTAPVITQRGEKLDALREKLGQ